MMADILELVDDEIRAALLRTHTALMGRITAIDGNTAHVRPLQREYPLLQNVPMMQHRYRVDVGFTVVGGGSYGGEQLGPTTFNCYGPHYQVDDVVLVVFLEAPRDGVGERDHSLEDGIIVGRVIGT